MPAASGTSAIQDRCLLRDLSVMLSRRVASAEVSASVDRDEPLARSEGVFALYQDSSGGERWRHVNHVNRDGVVPTTFRGYRALRGSVEQSGLRASPVVSSGVGDERLTVAMRHFWETFPKAIEADSERVAVGVLPRQFADVHELQGGERCSTTFAVCFGPDPVSAEPLFWVRSPLRVTADPGVVRAGRHLRAPGPRIASVPGTLRSNWWRGGRGRRFVPRAA